MADKSLVQDIKDNWREGIKSIDGEHSLAAVIAQAAHDWTVKNVPDQIGENAKEAIKTLGGMHSVEGVIITHVGHTVDDWKIKAAQSLHDPKAEALFREAQHAAETNAGFGFGGVVPTVKAEGMLIADEFSKLKESIGGAHHVPSNVSPHEVEKSAGGAKPITPDAQHK